MRKRSKTIAAHALLAVAVLSLYASTLFHDFVKSEDLLHIQYVSGVLERDGLVGLLTADYRQNPSLPMGYYRPVVQLSFAFDQWVSGAPWFFHMTSVLVHLASTLLVFWLLFVLFEQLSPALLGALLFAVHPIHTECVAFIAARTDPWVGLFLLSAVITWLRVRKGWSRRPVLETVLGAVAFALAVSTKEVAYVAPAVLLAWDAILPNGRAGWMRRNTGWLAAWGAATALCLAIRLGPAATGFGLSSTGLEAGTIPGVSSDIWMNLGSALTSLKLLVWPWPMKVAYLDDSVRISAVTLLGAAVLIGFCGAAASRSGRRGGLLGLAWIAVFLAPASGFVTLASYHLHERFLYIPSIGLSVAAAALAVRWLGDSRRTRLVWTAAALVLATFAAMTVARVSVWKNDVTLWSYAIRTDPDSWVGHFYLAKIRMEAGDLNGAIAGFERTMELVPDFAPAWLEMGFAHAAAGRHEESLEALLQARRINPRLPHANSNVAVAYRTLGRHREAAAALREELRFQPESPRVYYDLSVELLFAGDLAGALSAVDESLRLVPGSADGHNLRGVVLLRMGRMSEVMQELQFLEQNAPEAAEQLRQAIASHVRRR